MARQPYINVVNGYGELYLVFDFGICLDQFLHCSSFIMLSLASCKRFGLPPFSVHPIRKLKSARFLVQTFADCSVRHTLSVSVRRALLLSFDTVPILEVQSLW